MVSVQVLKEFSLFTGLDDSQLTRIAELCHERTLDKNALCFSQGKRAMELHLCRSGKVHIWVKVFDMETVVHTGKAGEVFGWSALVEPYIYTASAKCVEKVDEIYIERPALINLFEREPVIGYIMMRNLSALVSSRLTETTDALAKEIAVTISRDREW